MSAIITIIIVNYKTPELVCKAVSIAQEQAFSDNINLHIVVVDNGSDDGSLAMIRSACPDIEMIDAGANIGFSAGNNLVLKNIVTPYALLLNSDAFIQKNMLGRLIEVMEKNPEIGVIGPRVLNPDGSDQDYPNRFPTILEMMRRAIIGAQFPAKGKNTRTVIPIERIHGCCLMMRREVLRQIGLLDEQFFMYDEDMDWCLRARNAGWQLALVADASVIHLGGQSSGRAPSGKREEKTLRPYNPRMSFELRKSRYILYRKHRITLEIIMLKLLTDTMLLMGCVLLLPQLRSHETRGHAKKRLRGNAAIMAINPFALKVVK